MDNSIIITEMSELKKDYIAKELDKIYSDIYEHVKTASAETFANLFTSIEAKAISSFYVQLEKTIRLSAYEAMKNAGVSENDIPMVWIRARHDVSAPQPRLCNEEKYIAPQVQASKTDVKQNIKENSQTPKMGKWILISGVAVEVLSWIFIPSIMLWAPIVRGIGLVIIGAGAYTIYQESKSPVRIPLTEEAKKKEQKKSLENVKEICSKQYDLNYGIYCDWLDSITDAIVKECANC